MTAWAARILVAIETGPMSTETPIAAPESIAASKTPASPLIPRLHAGDCPRSDEFPRRDFVITDVNDVELIEGVVYTPSPVFASDDGELRAELLT
jgi:hypothetical protein